MIEVLRAGRKAVSDATGTGRDALNSQEIEKIRAAYREQAQIGITASYGPRTGKGGKHPAWVPGTALPGQDRHGAAPPDRLHRALDVQPRRHQCR
jgi:hypothetical protein